MARKANVSCDYCDSPFYKRPNSLKSNKRGHFCSTPCYSKWRLERSEKKACPICESVFSLRKKDQVFCSLTCSATRPRKVKWNGKGKNHKATLRKMLLDLGWDKVCMVIGCTYSRTHDIHRLVPGKEGGEYVLGNIFAICPNHHAEEHRKLIKLQRIGDMLLSATEA